MQWGIHHHTAACKCQQKRNSLTPCQGWYWSWRQCLPLHVFQHLYPGQMSSAGLPTGLDHVSTRLNTYNGSHIPLYGALHGPITWQPDCPGSWTHRVNSYWYITDTPGPTILGLPSSEKLAVMKMNCAITVRQPSTHPAHVSTTAATTKPATAPEAAKPIRSTDDLINEFPDWLKVLADSLANTRSNSIMMHTLWYMPPGNASLP